MITNELDRLIQMANHIAAHNDFHGDTTQAAAATASHLRKFWARAMKESIIRYVAEDGTALSPAARLAIQQLDNPQPHTPETR
ncbi:MAG: formate dehydrogenase subunit delta [Marinobacterium sp.]|nr:formate dehydrogenase subunit delta [Marinobacterium sp.]